MPVGFQCPNCKARYDIAEDMVGKTMLCRECEQRVSVPAPGAANKPAHPALKAAVTAGDVSRRKMIVVGVSTFLPGMLLGWLGGYFWKRPLPWEGASRSRRERPEGAPEGEQTAEGQGPDGQPRRPGRGGGRPGGGGGGRRGGRPGGNGGQNPPGDNPQGGNPPPANPPAANPPPENPPRE